MRRTRNETGIERVWRSYLKLQIFGTIALIIVAGAIIFWMMTRLNTMKEEAKVTDAKWEQIIKEKEDDMQKKYESFEESTNQSVENTINDIQGATENNTCAEYYEDVYTTSETQESVEQSSQETNATTESASETETYKKKELPEPVKDDIRVNETPSQKTYESNSTEQTEEEE